MPRGMGGASASGSAAKATGAGVGAGASSSSHGSSSSIEARRRREEMAANVVKRTQTLAASMVKSGWLPPEAVRGASRAPGGGRGGPGGTGAAGSGAGGGGGGGGGKPNKRGGAAKSKGGGGGSRPRQQLSPEAMKLVQEKVRTEKAALFTKYRFGQTPREGMEVALGTGRREAPPRSLSDDRERSLGHEAPALVAPAPDDRLETGWRFQRVKDE
jgi:hypothetical protein